MLGLYFKQAWNLLKQEKLFSAIYILGTAVCISVVMILSIVLYIKTGNIYPETNRSRLLIIRSGKVTEGFGTSSAGLSYFTAKKCLDDLKYADVVSIVPGRGSNSFARKTEKDLHTRVSVKYVDYNYWKVFPFLFKDGTPFSEGDFSSGIQTVVISETTAHKLFGETNVSGRYILVGYDEYRIAGVVKDPSFALQRTFADMWIPFTVRPYYMEEADVLGSMTAYILAPSVKETGKVKQEIQENIQKFAGTLPEKSFTIGRQPLRQWEDFMCEMGGNEYDGSFMNLIFRYILAFLLMLIVPAVSLSGMIDSRMERRLSEFGIRRTFGAPVGTLMKQVIQENLFFTFLGGIVGLLFSYVIVYATRSMVLDIGAGWVTVPPAGTDVVITFGMLFNVPLFCTVFFFCIVLNLISALLPAWRASNQEIFYSLTDK